MERETRPGFAIVPSNILPALLERGEDECRVEPRKSWARLLRLEGHIASTKRAEEVCAEFTGLKWHAAPNHGIECAILSIWRPRKQISRQAVPTLSVISIRTRRPGRPIGARC